MHVVEKQMDIPIIHYKIGYFLNKLFGDLEHEIAFSQCSMTVLALIFGHKLIALNDDFEPELKLKKINIIKSKFLCHETLCCFYFFFLFQKSLI